MLTRYSRGVGTLVSLALTPCMAEIAVAQERKVTAERRFVTWYAQQVEAGTRLVRSFCPGIPARVGQAWEVEALLFFADVTRAPKLMPYSGEATTAAFARLLELIRDEPDARSIRFTAARVLHLVARYGNDEEIATGARARALEYLEGLTAQEPKRTSYRWWLALAYSDAGDALQDDSKRSGKAWEDYRKAIQLLEQLAAEYPERAPYRVGLAYAWNGLGGIHFASLRHAEAKRAYEKALDLRRELARDDPLILIEVAGSTANIGNVILEGERKPAEALPWFEKAIAIEKRVIEEDSDQPNARHYLTSSHWGLVLAYLQLKKFKEADDAWATVLKYATKADVPRMRIDRAYHLANAGAPERGAREAETLDPATKSAPDHFFRFAKLFAELYRQEKDPAKANAHAGVALKYLGDLVKLSPAQAEEIDEYTRNTPAFERLRRLDAFKVLFRQAKKERK
jgi:tetratricopeptide (TPR) repeat protein